MLRFIPPPTILLMMAGIIVLSSVWLLQYGFGLQPCPLCYYQRYPWWLLFFLGVIGYINQRWLDGGYYHKTTNQAPWVLVMGIFVMIFSIGLSGYHMGVEYQWWPGPATCGLTNFNDSIGKVIDDFFSSTNVVSCDVPAVIFLGLSLSGWNFVASTALAGLLVFLLYHDNKATK